VAILFRLCHRLTTSPWALRNEAPAPIDQKPAEAGRAR
jgi:hypothetical protein